MIRDFATGAYLPGQGGRTRPKLPVAPPAASREILLVDPYPEQSTSWSAVYHVLQRYGAFVALRRFTDVFDVDGMFRHD